MHLSCRKDCRCEPLNFCLPHYVQFKYIARLLLTQTGSRLLFRFLLARHTMWEGFFSILKPIYGIFYTTKSIKKQAQQ